MDFRFNPEEEAYRAEVRGWLADHIPEWWREVGDREVGEDDDIFPRLREWHAELYDAGYVGVTWPPEYGGQGRSHVENALLQEELVVSGAPPTVNGLGIGLCGPAIIHHGSEEQKQRFLRPMLRADEMWCQGYSEPGAGSDLANVQTRAVVDGDDYVVNGQKIWTSSAHLADWNFCLVRSAPEAAKHDGIGFLLVDMASPGIEVAPLIQLTGNKNFSQVFYKDVRVPRANMVGGPTEGWRVANTVLGYERGASTLSRYATYKRSFDQLVDLAKRRRDARPASARDIVERQAIADMAIDVETLRLNSLRQLSALAQGIQPGPEASIQKLHYSELQAKMYRLANELNGPFGQLARGEPRAIDRGRWTQRELGSRGPLIFAGTNEIQRNIISERVLGLPRR